MAPGPSAAPPPASVRALLLAAEQEWDALLDMYLTPAGPDDFWRFSRPHRPGRDAEQGWKLHLSATVVSAPELIRRTAGALRAHDVLWKAPATLQGIQQLNAGLLNGYSQVGKIVTVFPPDDDTAHALARELDHLLEGLPGPVVPFDRLLRPGSRVHYRYGVHTPRHQVKVDGREVPALRAPDGTLVPDSRGPGSAVPTWVEDTIGEARRDRERPDSPLSRRYLAYESLSQRGKGGTYLAVDVGTTPARRCVLREGRRNGETELDRRDGAARIAHERRALTDLHRRGVRVPQVLASFVVQGNQYLVLEHLPGRNLQALLARPEGTAGLDRAQLAEQVTDLVTSLHEAGWAWRDCKPANIVITDRGPYAVDLEGASRLGSPDPWPWGSPGHVPPGWPEVVDPVGQDLYALQVVRDALAAPPDARPPLTR